MRRIPQFLFFLLLLCASVSLRGETLASPRWQTMADVSTRMDLAAVRAMPANQWRLEGSAMVSYGFSSANIWLTTAFQATERSKYVLELANPLLDEAQLYLVREDGRIEMQQGGFMHSDKNPAASKYHNQLFSFQLAAGEKVTLYLQVATTRALILWPRVSTDTGFAFQALGERLWIGLMAGLFVALTVYFLMVWRATKDRDFLNYLLFLGGNGLLQMQLLGVLHEFFLYQHPRLMDACNNILPVLVFVAMIRFTISFLDLPRYSPRSIFFLRMCSWISIGILGVYLVGGSRWSVPLLNLTGVLVIVVGISAACVAWSRGYRPARFYVVAQTVLGLGGLCYVLIRFNQIPAVPLTVYSFQLSSALEVLLTAIALADKINILQRDRDQAQNERLGAERQLVEALRESEAMLEHRVKERTLQLEDALRQQCEQGETLLLANQKMLTLNDERSAILSIAAHDLKNPTAAIMSYVDLITDRWHEYDDSKKLKRLASIRSLAQLIHEIIRNLLDVNAIETGSYTLNPVLLNPAELCVALIEEYRVRADAKHIELHHDLQPGLLVLADRSALHQVLDNLISNAIKYSPPGMNVYLELAAKNSGVEIRIRDEGPGLSAEDQTKLFRKFTRLSARPTGGEHSTGLGLSIVKQIVEACGGTVGCESRLGEGAIFFVWLPSARQDDWDGGCPA